MLPSARLSWLERVSSRRAGLRRGAAVLLAAGWLVGLGRFLAASGALELTLPRLGVPPQGQHNLASWRFGPTLRATSYHRDVFAQNHPAFLVDGHDHPDQQEKWASAAADRDPVLEVRWREARTLARVVLRHAGAYEPSAPTLSRYTLVCLQDGGPAPGTGAASAAVRVIVENNHDPVSVHPLPCARARGVRLEAHPAPGDVVRLFELEAWGE